MRERQTDTDHMEAEEEKGFREGEELQRISGKWAQALASIWKNKEMEKKEKEKLHFPR